MGCISSPASDVVCRAIRSVLPQNLSSLTYSVRASTSFLISCLLHFGSFVVLLSLILARLLIRSRLRPAARIGAFADYCKLRSQQIQKPKTIRTGVFLHKNAFVQSIIDITC